MSKYINANDIKSQLRGRWLNVYLSLAPTLSDAVQNVGKHVSCPPPYQISGLFGADWLDAIVSGYKI